MTHVEVNLCRMLRYRITTMKTTDGILKMIINYNSKMQFWNTNLKTILTSISCTTIQACTPINRIRMVYAGTDTTQTWSPSIIAWSLHKTFLTFLIWWSCIMTSQINLSKHWARLIWNLWYMMSLSTSRSQDSTHSTRGRTNSHLCGPAIAETFLICIRFCSGRTKFATTRTT